MVVSSMDQFGCASIRETAQKRHYTEVRECVCLSLQVFLPGCFVGNIRGKSSVSVWVCS